MLLDRLYTPNDRELIYHYCSAESFLSILKSQTIWFSAYYMLNDSLEHEWGHSILSKVLEEHQRRLDKTFVKRIEALVAASYFSSVLMISSYSLEGDDLGQCIVSIGIPILLVDGCTLYRGPLIKIPEYRGSEELAVTPAAIDAWADKGWVDLRSANMAKWQGRLRQMTESGERFFGHHSSELGRGPFPKGPLEIGDVVGWIFNNDPAIAGFRLKSS